MPQALRMLNAVRRSLAAGLVALVAASAAYASVPADGPVVVDRSVTIVLADDAPGAIREAANDLAADLEKIIGTKPRVTDKADGAGAVVIWIGEYAALPQALAAGCTARDGVVVHRSAAGGECVAYHRAFRAGHARDDLCDL